MLGIEARHIRVSKVVVGDELVGLGKVTEVGPTEDPWRQPTDLCIKAEGGSVDIDPDALIKVFVDNNDRR